jgi:hypothetical protein
MSKMPLAKKSDLGGKPTQQFERSFAELGLAYIQDSAPELIDRLIGFQLVNRSNDSEKAFGVFGFQIGDTLAYAPVIFMSGEIKGNEILYLKDLDLFIPLTESWINYILSQFSSNQIGSSSIGSPQELGMMPPNILPMVHPPLMGKRGFFRPSVREIGWHSSTRGFAPFYAALSQKPLEKAGSSIIKKSASLDLDVGGLLNKLLRVDPSFVKNAMDICDAYPAIGDAWRKFHGDDVFERAIFDQQARYKQADVPAPGLLSRPQLLRGDHAGLGFNSGVDFYTSPKPWMTEKQAAEVARRGYLIEDSRPVEKLSAVAVRNTQRISNPTQTGLYEILTEGGSFERALVIVGPKGQREDRKGAVAVKVDGHGYTDGTPSKMFVRLPGESPEEYRKWFDGLSSSDMESGSTYVLVAENGEASIAFRVSSKNDDDTYEVWPDTYGCFSCSNDGSGYNDYHGPSLSLLRKKPGSKFRFWDGLLEAPKGSKAVKVSGDFKLGTTLDMEQAVQEKSASLHLRVDGPEVSINRARPVLKFAALKSLMVDHGLGEIDANELLKWAESSGRIGNGFTARIVYGETATIKKAAPGGMGSGGLLDASGIGAPPFPEPDMGYGSPWSSGGVQEQAPLESAEQVPGLGAANNDPSIYDQSPESGAGTSMMDPGMMQQAQQAGQSGQKELFDTSMLSSLAKGMRPQSRVQEWSKDLIQAMDRLGRILLLFYWHNDEFADRYGKNDLPDLEDAIRNAFDALGEVALFLKEKDIEPLGGLQMGEASVDQIAG